MLGYSEKCYGCRGLTLDKHWDAQCSAMEPSVRRQRPLFLLVLEASGPDSSWKPQFSWPRVLCSSRSTRQNSGWLIPNSSGVPRNVHAGAGSLVLLQGKSLLPRHDVGSHQPSFSQVTPLSPWEGLVTLLQHRAGSGEPWETCASWGCYCGERSVRELAPHPGITHAMIWGIHPSQFTIQTSTALCVYVT